MNTDSPYGDICSPKTRYEISCEVRKGFLEHGEELRRWHNLDTQIGDEGEKANKGKGVLNPAIMKIG